MYTHCVRGGRANLEAPLDMLHRALQGERVQVAEIQDMALNLG